MLLLIKFIEKMINIPTLYSLIWPVKSDPFAEKGFTPSFINKATTRVSYNQRVRNQRKKIKRFAGATAHHDPTTTDTDRYNSQRSTAQRLDYAATLRATLRRSLSMSSSRSLSRCLRSGCHCCKNARNLNTESEARRKKTRSITIEVIVFFLKRKVFF